MPGEFGRLWMIFILKFMKEPTEVFRDPTDSYQTAVQSLGFTIWVGATQFPSTSCCDIPSNTACTRSSSFVDTNLLTNASNMWEVMVHSVYVDGWYDGMVWVAKACYRFGSLILSTWETSGSSVSLSLSLFHDLPTSKMKKGAKPINTLCMRMR